MKRIYIKPYIEELCCDDFSLLAGSSNSKSKMGNEDIDDSSIPKPKNARGYDGFIDDDVDDDF